MERWNRAVEVAMAEGEVETRTGESVHYYEEGPEDSARGPVVVDQLGRVLWKGTCGSPILSPRRESTSHRVNVYHTRCIETNLYYTTRHTHEIFPVRNSTVPDFGVSLGGTSK